MLDNQTKRLIDSARDILVGKVPDPKGQIEHITIALIYKFMDDMDRETVEKFGGKAKFFTGEYEKFSWRKLFDPKLGGHDMLALYREALEKMYLNPNIPELFISIFKNAYLSFNSPETLKLFLKTINEFNYDHSENLGNAYEYLLSVLGTQGDAGQFRTPRHIIEFIVECVAPQKHETILDPACGTAGFILSAYKHILRNNCNKHDGDTLTPYERKQIAENLVGYDIDPNMIRFSLVNMFLHKFQTPRIYEYDTLSSEDRWNESYDVIVANPPFMTPKGGIKPHKRFSIQATKSEVLFTDYIAEHLATNGRAGIIIPNGIVATTQNAYTSLRKMLVENYLVAVVSLPAGVFNPYSGVKTSVLLLDKALAKKTDSILFLKIENDGYDLGAQRREIDKNDLPEALKIFKEYKSTIEKGQEFVAEEKSLAMLVERKKILENKDVNLSGDRYLGNSNKLISDFQIVPINTVCEFKRGTSITKQNVGNGNIPVIAGGQQAAYYHNISNRNIGSITVSSSGAYAGFVAYHDYPIFASDCFTISSIDKNLLDDKFLFNLIKGKQEEIYKRQEGGGQPHVYPKNFDDWEIPLPPLEIQQQIVAEIEGYQKVIDGARMVVANYKPAIKIKPEWEMVELGEVCENFKNGLNFSTEQVGRGTKFINIKDLFSNGYVNIETLDKVEISEKEKVSKKVFDDDLLFVRSSVKYEGVGFPSLAKSNGEDVVFCGFIIKCTPKKDIIQPKFLLNLLRTPKYRSETVALSNKANITNISQEYLKSIKIVVPPLEEQTAIVEQIEEEQKMVEANKKLIEIFEKKIKEKISEVWGEKE